MKLDVSFKILICVVWPFIVCSDLILQFCLLFRTNAVCSILGPARSDHYLAHMCCLKAVALHISLRPLGCQFLSHWTKMQESDCNIVCYIVYDTIYHIVYDIIATYGKLDELGFLS